MIPNVWHFIHLQKPLNGKPMVSFGGMHYAALMSCAETQKPDRIVVWSDGPMDGMEWWERACTAVKTRYNVIVEAKLRVFKHVHKGKRIPSPGFVADIARYEILYEFGGIYADIDAIFMKPIRSCPTWDEQKTLFWDEVFLESSALVNTVIATEPGSEVIKSLLNYDRPGEFEPMNAVFMKCAIMNAKKQFSDRVAGLRLEDNPKPVWTEEGRNKMFLDVDYDTSNAYVIALGLSSNQYYLQFASGSAVFELRNTYHNLIKKYFDRPVLDLTAIMPVCIDSTDRFENIMSITAYMHENLGIPNIFIVEYDIRPRLAEFFIDKPGIRYFFVQRPPGALWSRSRPVNTALQWVETSVVAVWDTDVLISLGQVTSACDAVTGHGYAAVTPFNVLYHVRRKHLGSVRLGRLNFGIVNDPKEVLWKIEHAVAQACVFLNTAKFKHARGMSELFWGWGAEDDELMLRMTKLYGPTIQLGAPAIHIAHARTTDCFPDKQHGKLNEGERQRIMDWTPAQVREYYGVTEKVGKYSTQVHPAPVDDELRARVEDVYRGINVQAGVPPYRET